MAHISGVDLLREKCIETGLTYIYGIGVTSSNRILSQASVDLNTRVKDFTDDEVKKIAEVIAETQVVEGDLRRQIVMGIEKPTGVGRYHGIRHRKGLPVRGQRTRMNARTCKDPRKTVVNKEK